MANQETLHISQVSDKTANNLSKQNLDKDPYHNQIKNASYAMVIWEMQDWEYLGQYSSGTTIWGKGEARTSISPSEVLEAII